MSFERALLAQALPQMLAAKARAMVAAEAAKGCLPTIAPEPVALEPPYEPLLGRRYPAGSGQRLWTPEPPNCESSLTRLRIWISPNQGFDWKRAERLLKLLGSASHRMALEILGNREDIRMQLLCHSQDVPVVRNAFLAEFEHCLLSPTPIVLGRDASNRGAILFRDYYPPSPYSHLLTRPDELRTTLYAPIIQAIAGIAPPGMGIYQVVFAPVSETHDWHRNVQALLDIEFSIKLMGNAVSPYRSAQQAPSGDLRQMAMDTETKAHTDKPFFAVALRIGVWGNDLAQQSLLSLGTFSRLIQSGGRPLCQLTDREYRESLGPVDLESMFRLGLTYRPGFLVNSWELTSLVHVPAINLADPRRLPMVRLETLPADASLSTGIPIGICPYAGRELRVCIPPSVRGQHVHLIGRSGMGKSTMLGHAILGDIEQGHGVAVLDPHGDLVSDLLSLIPKQHADRVIYVDPGDPDYVLMWNPLTRSPGEAIDRGWVASDIVSAFKSCVDGWGDRLEHLLRHAVEGVLYLPQGALLDVSNALRRKSPEGEALRKRIIAATDNPVCRRFWSEDFKTYTNADLTPPQHKLSKLLGSGPVSLMLSQPHSAFQFREIMNQGRILLVNLATVGPETRNILGCFMLSLLHLAALSRSSQSKEDRRPFHTYCDEAHRFVTDALEDLIAETRKFGVSLTLAHQYMTQFETRKADALSGVGSTIIFNVDGRDAQHLRKDLRGMVEVEDLTRLNKYEAIARIGAEIVRVKTLGPLQRPADNCRDQIIAASRQRYYRPTAEVRRMLGQSNLPAEPIVACSTDPTAKPQEFMYEEL